VGKSTWIGERLPDAHRFDLLDEGLYQRLLADPAQFAGELRFALLGSSARKLRAAGVNLLGGRALWREMFPLTPEELGEDFDLDRALEVGGLPLVLASEQPHETLPVAGLFHGQLLNVAGVARDAGVARTTVEGYLEVLEDTLLARRLPAYEARLRVRERKHPKLYWMDPGVARAAKGVHGAVVPEESGPLLEGWVHGLLCTLEVKASRRVHPADLAGLRAIGELPGLRRRVLIHRGERPTRMEDGIDAWPVETFLEALAGDRLWP